MGGRVARATAILADLVGGDGPLGAARAGESESGEGEDQDQGARPRPPIRVAYGYRPGPPPLHGPAPGYEPFDQAEHAGRAAGALLALDAVVVDLALQALGAEPVAVEVPWIETAATNRVAGEGCWTGEAGRRGADLAILAPGATDVSGGAAADAEPRVPGRRPGGSATAGGGASPRRHRPRSGAPSLPSGWTAEVDVAPANWRVVVPPDPSAAPPAGSVPGHPAEAVVTAARSLVGPSPATPATARRAEVTIAAPRLAAPGPRLLVAWSLVAGAALVLEPSRSALAATAAWARPTLLAADGADLARLRHEAESWHADWRLGPLLRLWHHLRGTTPDRRPFGRLHTLVHVGDPPSADFWRDRGVALRDLASLLP